jgi:KaiC/GvpD/RAD55 family RecA-like ATPase
MVSKELISRSPLRILEKSTHGGVGKGNIGIIAARKGVGKTACLVHIATDQLLQGKNIIHVSFASDTAHIIKWYDDIFREIALRNNIEGQVDVYDQIARNRVIMNFKQGGLPIENILGSIKSMVQDGHFTANVIMVDGYDFAKSSIEEFAAFKRFAEELKISLWFSATIHRDDPTKDANGVPMILSPYMDNTAILILLDPREDCIHLKLVKDHTVFPSPDSLHLKLDPQIMLIATEK